MIQNQGNQETNNSDPNLGVHLKEYKNAKNLYQDNSNLEIIEEEKDDPVIRDSIKNDDSISDSE